MLGTLGVAQAGIIQLAPDQYEISYLMNVAPATPTGGDILDVFIFEWDDNDLSKFSVDSSFTIAGSGNTELTHTIGFMPTSAFAIGYIDALPGADPTTFEGKRHLYTLNSTDYNEYLALNNPGQIFSAIFGIVEQDITDLLFEAGTNGNLAARQSLIDFVQQQIVGGPAPFDPAGPFEILHWSLPEPGGGSLPEPSVLLLFGLGLAALYSGRRKRALHCYIHYGS